MRASERAYVTLLDDILEWRLPPRTVRAEVDQSERLGVSRTSLREALGRLTAEGLQRLTGGEVWSQRRFRLIKPTSSLNFEKLSNAKLPP